MALRRSDNVTRQQRNNVNHPANMFAKRPRFLCCVITLLLCYVAACERKPAHVLSPRETVLKLRELHVRRGYAEMEALIVRGRGGAVVELLGAIDQFTAANRELI